MNGMTALALAFLALILGPGGTVLAAHPDMPEVQTQNGIHYVAGGIGKEQSEALKMVAKDYDLMLNFADGFLESEFKQKRARFESLRGDVTELGATDRGDEESQPYILLEGGSSYTHALDHLPAYLPLSLATVYAGYRYQDFDTDTGTSGDFNDNEGRDVTRGFSVGVNLTY